MKKKEKKKLTLTKFHRGIFVTFYQILIRIEIKAGEF